MFTNFTAAANPALFYDALLVLGIVWVLTSDLYGWWVRAKGALLSPAAVEGSVVGGGTFSSASRVGWDVSVSPSPPPSVSGVDAPSALEAGVVCMGDPTNNNNKGGAHAAGSHMGGIAQQRHVTVVFALMVAAEAVQLPFAYHAYARGPTEGHFQQYKGLHVPQVVDRLEHVVLYMAYLGALGVAVMMGLRRSSSSARRGGGGGAAAAAAATVRAMCIACGLMGAVGCLLRSGASLGTQLVSRGVLGGASTGLLLVGFEGWLMASSSSALPSSGVSSQQRRNAIHATMLHIACVVGIPSCLLGQALASSSSYSHSSAADGGSGGSVVDAVFVCAAALYIIAVICIKAGAALNGGGEAPPLAARVVLLLLSPGTNLDTTNASTTASNGAASNANGDVVAEGSGGASGGSLLTLQQVCSEVPLLLMGFIWAPALDPSAEDRIAGMRRIPYGVIVACFIVAAILGRNAAHHMLARAGRSTSSSLSSSALPVHGNRLVFVSFGVTIVGVTLYLHHRRPIRFLGTLLIAVSVAARHVALSALAAVGNGSCAAASLSSSPPAATLVSSFRTMSFSTALAAFIFVVYCVHAFRLNDYSMTISHGGCSIVVAPLAVTIAGMVFSLVSNIAMTAGRGR